MVVLLGKVRTALAKRTAKKLLSAYPDYFNDDLSITRRW